MLLIKFIDLFTPFTWWQLESTRGHVTLMWLVALSKAILVLWFGCMVLASFIDTGSSTVTFNLDPLKLVLPQN